MSRRSGNMLRALGSSRLRAALLRQTRRQFSAKDEVEPFSKGMGSSSTNPPKVMSLFSRKKPSDSTSASAGGGVSSTEGGKAKPNLQSLIEKFKTDASVKAKSAAGTSRGQGGGRQHQNQGQGQNNRNGSTMRSTSVRDSFRMKEAERRGDGQDRGGKPRHQGGQQQGNNQYQNRRQGQGQGRGSGGRGGRGNNNGGRGGGGRGRGDGGGMDRRRARQVSDNIMDSVTSTIPSVSMANDADEYEGGAEITDQQHKRYQERLRRDKQRFNQKVAVDEDSQGRRGKRGRDGGYSSGGSDGGMIGIAEMKARTASRLNRKQSNYGGYGSGDSRGESKLDGDKAATAKVDYRTVVKEVSIPPEGLSIRNLASRLSLRIDDVKSKLSDLGETVGSAAAGGRRGKTKGNANVNQDGVDEAEQIIEPDVVELVVLEMGIEATREVDDSTRSDRDRDFAAADEALLTEPRAPIVCIMGHVDHGKTTLLDALRASDVASGEAGGITQKLSAFRVEVGGRQVAFLDTPGHAAFSTMRSHGVCATDLVVLVVAIDDGVKSQTREALRTAKDAGCTIVVAITKSDKIPPGQARETAKAKIYSQLSEEGLMCEEFGGDVMAVEVSAQSGENVMDGLIEGLLLQADVLELEAATEGQCEAVVLDANMEKGRGVVADVLVRWGRLQVGDAVIVDTAFGRVKAMMDDRGKAITEAGPSTPVRVLGLRSVPTVGQELLSVDNEAKARSIVDRRTKLKEARGRAMKQGGSGGGAAGYGTAGDADDVPTLPVYLKADGVGTLEALEKIVRDLGSRTDDVNLVVVKSGVGDVNRSEVETAATAGARVLGFNVGLADSATRAAMKELSVPVDRDTIIYRLEESLVQVMQTLMPKERREVIEGTAVVQKVFTLRDKQSTNVAGLVVQDGKLSTSENKSGAPLMYKVTRDGYVSAEEEANSAGDSEEDEDKLKGVVFSELEVNNGTAQLKRFKDVVSVVEQGNDCGLVLSKFKGWQEGDVVHCFRVEYETKRLQLSSPAA